MNIKNLINRAKYTYKDFAVFMRVNAITRAVEQEFTKYGIPYKIYGGFRFYERKEIKDILSYLKLIVNPLDDESFLRAVGSPKRGIGDKTLNELKEYATLRSLSIFDSIDWLDATSISSSAKVKLYNFKQLINSFTSFSRENGISQTLDFILDKTSFLEQFAEKNDENESRKMNIAELKNDCISFEKINPGALLTDYLNSVTLSSDTDDINETNAVTVATIHAVKGLEYPCVFVIGLDEKILPILRSYENDSEMEEERRLMYVAITRARERLFLTRANSRFLYGHREFMIQSRFLKEAQPLLNPSFDRIKSDNKQAPYERKGYYNEDGFEGDTSYFNSGYSSSYAKTMLSDNKPKINTTIQSGYKTGVKVKHTKFGEGTVIATKGSGDMLVVDVAFVGVGIKSLAVKYAPLEIINGK